MYPDLCLCMYRPTVGQFLSVCDGLSLKEGLSSAVKSLYASIIAANVPAGTAINLVASKSERVSLK